MFKFLKRIFLSKYLLLSILMMLGNISLAMGEIEQFELSTCTIQQKKCVSIKADKSKSSYISNQIYSLKNIAYVTVENNQKKVTTYERGHIDFTSNQVVLFKKQNSLNIEVVVNLKSLNETRSETLSETIM